MSNFLPAESSFGARWQAFVSEAVDTSLVSVSVWEVWTVNHAPRRGHPLCYCLRYRFCCFKSLPAKGASVVRQQITGSLDVSSHAPAKGATRSRSRSSPWALSFKSCPREGATMASRWLRSNMRGFKSCPREGATLIFCCCSITASRFQVMPPRRGQLPNLPSQTATCKSFKSCPREGGNVPNCKPCPDFHSFKSCPREGATSKMLYCLHCRKFQVMPPRGGNDILGHSSIKVTEVSSHAPARGQLYTRCCVRPKMFVSSHAPARGQPRCRLTG